MHAFAATCRAGTGLAFPSASAPPRYGPAVELANRAVAFARSSTRASSGRSGGRKPEMPPPMTRVSNAMVSVLVTRMPTSISSEPNAEPAESAAAVVENETAIPEACRTAETSWPPLASPESTRCSRCGGGRAGRRSRKGCARRDHGRWPWRRTVARSGGDAVVRNSVVVECRPGADHTRSREDGTTRACNSRSMGSSAPPPLI